MKKTIRDYNLNDKKVIIRVDFNVPIKNGIILDDNRIKQSLRTINYAIENGAKIILLSHLGRIKTQEDKINNSLECVSKRLSELLDKKVIFLKETRSKKIEEAVNKMKSGDVLLLENTRYEDLDGKKESNNDDELGKYWASLGDVFINDAFGTCHRSHASNVGIATNLQSGIGFLVEKEIKIIEDVIEKPKRPLTVILGGAKINDKIGLIKKLVKIADYILIGGGMAFTFLKASGLEIGKSILDEENVDFCKQMLREYEDKIILPIDAIVVSEVLQDSKVSQCFISDMKASDIGVDIGRQTVELFNEYLVLSKTIIWNGPVGMFEYELFSNGTKELLETVSKTHAITILGGGDTASSAKKFGYENCFSHVSTGGGAMLELLEGRILKGIEVIDEK